MVLFPISLVTSAITNILTVCGPELAHVAVVEEWDGTVDLVKVEGLGLETVHTVDEFVLDIAYMDGQRQTMGAGDFKGIVRSWLGAEVLV